MQPLHPTPSAASRQTPQDVEVVAPSQDPWNLWRPGYTNLRYDAVLLEDELPPTVKSLRDGWQTTFQSAAVVSALLAEVSSQLYSFFKDPSNYALKSTNNEYKDAVVSLCYVSIFLNIAATVISGFIIIDALGEMQYRAATLPPNFKRPFPENDPYNEDVRLVWQGIPGMLKSYSRGWKIDVFVYHWFFSFCGGILSLLSLLLLYIVVEERMAVKGLGVCMLLYALFPALYWMRHLRLEEEIFHWMRSAVRGAPPAGDGSDGSTLPTVMRDANGSGPSLLPTTTVMGADDFRPIQTWLA